MRSIKNFYYRSIKNFYYNLKYGLLNLINWFPVIWKNRDWGDRNIYVLLQKKIKHMIKFYQNSPFLTTDISNIIKQLQKADEILERIVKDNYLDECLVEYNKKYKEESLYSALLNGDKEQLKMFSDASKKSRELREKDKDRLFDLMKKYDYWW